MPLPATCTITGAWLTADNTAATGQVVITPVAATPGTSGYIVVAKPVIAILTAGAITETLVNTTGFPTLQYQIVEQIDGTPADTYVITPAGSSINLQTAPRGGAISPIYVLASTVGQASGVAALDGTGKVPVAQLPTEASEVASVTAADSTVTIGGTATNPTVAVGVIGQTQVTGLTAALTANTTALTAETTRAQAAEALLAPKASPALTGTPTAPTAAALTSTTQLATTSYTDTAVAVETTRAEAAESTLTGAVAAKYTKPGGGIPTSDLATVVQTDLSLAATALQAAPVTTVFGRAGAVVTVSGDYTVGQVTGAAPLASPALTGSPTAPTAAALTASTQVATTAYTDSAVTVETTRAQTAETARQLLLPAARVNWGQPVPVVTHFQTGHGWTANNWGSSNLNDTSDFVHGTQVITGTTPGNAGTFPTFTKTGMTAFSVVGQTLRVWVKCDNPQNLASLTLRIAGTGGIAGGNYLSWTIQQTSLDSANQVWCPAGVWTQMSLPMADNFSVGSPTPAAIAEARIIANDNGTAATVHFAGIDVYNGLSAKWPNGVVTICFDDSYVGQYSLARPLLGQYGYRATLFPIWDQIGAGGSMTMANVHLLHDLLDWEVAPHASTLANHSGFGSLTAAQIQADITASLAIQQAQGFGSSGAYAYPLGYFSTGQDAAVTELCKVARTIDHTMYTESLPVGNPLRLRSAAGIGGVGGIGVTTYTTATTGVFALTKASPAWTILTIHDVSAGTSGQINQISIADLTTLVASINSQGLAVATMGEVIASGAFGL